MKASGPSLRRHWIRALGAALACSWPVVSSTGYAADAHVHGEARLEISISREALVAVFRGPAQVFFGFEHAPTTTEESAIVRDALAMLRAPAQAVLAFTPSCSLSSARVKAPFPEGADAGNAAARVRHNDPGEHDHDHDLHEERQVAGAGQHYETSSRRAADNTGRSGWGHADLEAEYGFDCPAGAPERASVKAFAAFPALEKLDVAWISERGSGSVLLTPQTTGFKLSDR